MLTKKAPLLLTILLFFVSYWLMIWLIALLCGFEFKPLNYYVISGFALAVSLMLSCLLHNIPQEE